MMSGKYGPHMTSIKIIHVVICLILSFPLIANSAIFFSDGFETGDFTHEDSTSGAKWTGRNTGTNDTMTVSSDMAHSGTYSAKFHFDGNTDLADDAFSELRYSLGSGRTDWYLSYYIYFPSGFDVRDATGSDNNKIADIWGVDYQDSDVKFNVEMERDQSVGFKLKRNTTWPYETLQCSGVINAGPDQPRFTFTSSYFGRWVHLEYHYKLDNGTGNGQAQFFVDGDLKISMDDLSYIDAPCSPGYMLYGYLMGWANSGYTTDTDIYIDDVIFSTTYQGTDDGPIRSAPLPSSDLPYGTTETILGLTTFSDATCKYDLSSGVAYSSMANTFSTTGETTHTQTITGLINGQDIPYYIKCTDGTTANDTDLIIHIIVVTPDCALDAESCTTESDCAAYWPSNNWCTNDTIKCKSSSCESTCEYNDDFCDTEADCTTYWPSNNWCSEDSPSCKSSSCNSSSTGSIGQSGSSSLSQNGSSTLSQQ